MNNKHDSLNAREKEITESRRKFLKKAGRFAVYTPPAVMLLMKPSHATIMQSGIGTKPTPPVVEKPTPPTTEEPQPPQASGTLKQYINRTGPFEINAYRAQEAAKPASAQVSWIDNRRSWWSNFWGNVFGF